jgi:hypothetical protein
LVNGGTLAAVVEALARVCTMRAMRSGSAAAGLWNAAGGRLARTAEMIDKLGI